jgi:hypothetical protein
MTLEDIERFWSYVEKGEGCWLWKGAISTNPKLGTGGGYGVITIGGRMYRAHRVSYHIAHGDIHAGHVIMHQCDVRLCVRPEHLKLGDHRENMREMTARGRARGGRAPGELSTQAKLNTDKVVEIRRRAASGEAYSDIAKAFGVARSTVHRIVTGEKWKHVPGAVEQGVRIKAPEIDAEPVLSRARQGLPAVRIAQETGLAVWSVRRIVGAAGLSRKRGRPRKTPPGVGSP